MSDVDPTGTDWSSEEIDLIVADYFAMLRKDNSGEAYVKAHHNAALRDSLRRSRSSIEFKHQNISAVLRELGMNWLSGYRPAINFQRALIDGIERALDAGVQSFIEQEAPAGLAEDTALFFEQPPSLTPSHAVDNPALDRLVRKFDPAERDARNRIMGHRGEERIFAHERAQLQRVDRADLARKVRWVSQEDGDGAGFDILSFDTNGKERCIEVKTTSGHRETPFYISANELAFSNERVDAFRIVRLFDFARLPKAFELAPPLGQHVTLRPNSYRASFE